MSELSQSSHLPTAPEKEIRVPCAVRWWLGGMILMIFAMVVVGGVTRLTDSGLSMVEWRPILGAIPPLNEAQWEEAFEKYRQFPEYRSRAGEMGMTEFKFIFFWEYSHRLLGRLLGGAFFFPMVWFWWRGDLNRRLKLRLLLAFVLGGLQGLLGWYMVKSGLVDMPRVSHYRLAAHLSLALFLMAYLFWIWLDCGIPWCEPKPESSHHPTLLKWAARGLGAGVALQIVFGAFTAGLRAGKVFTTFPKMGDWWIPPGWNSQEPVWLNLLENPITVQWVHRCLAWGLLVATLSFVVCLFRVPGVPRLRTSAMALAGAILLQFILGVLTLLHAVPVGWASLHQVGACFLLLAVTAVNHSLSKG